MTNSILVLGVGPSNGLGAAIAQRFAREGYRTFIVGRDGERLGRVAAECGETVTALPGDATDRDAVVRIFDAVEAEVGVPTVVAYNAGNNRRIPFFDLDEATFTNFWRTCCLGGFLVGQEAARRMLTRGSGTITFTGASASRRGRPGFAHFAAGKAAIKAVAEAMAREFGPQGLHVAHVIIDGGINGERLLSRVPEMAKERGEGGLLGIEHIAETFWQLHAQHPSAWTFETELRPYKERF